MKLLEGQTVGIDLGTTFSTIAQIDDTGTPMCLENADAKVITPSVVLLAEDGKVVVGPSHQDAQQREQSNVPLLGDTTDRWNLPPAQVGGDRCPS